MVSWGRTTLRNWVNKGSSLLLTLAIILNESRADLTPCLPIESKEEPLQIASIFHSEYQIRVLSDHKGFSILKKDPIPYMFKIEGCESNKAMKGLSKESLRKVPRKA